MKIQRFLGGAVAADGGTISCRAMLEDDSVLECGLDARIPKTKSQRLVFLGAGYPTLPGARFLERDSAEEREFLSALQDFVRREPSDEIAALLLRGVLDR